jgi:hypothetical protein
VRALCCALFVADAYRRRRAQAEVPDGAEPLALGGVALGEGASDALAAAWSGACRLGRRRDGAGRAPLYDDAADFEALVIEVLARDIRSAHQRERAATAAGVSESASADAPLPPPSPLPPRGRWRVVLDGVNVGYEVDAAGVVTVTDAEVATSAAAEDMGAASAS